MLILYVVRLYTLSTMLHAILCINCSYYFTFGGLFLVTIGPYTWSMGMYMAMRIHAMVMYMAIRINVWLSFSEYIANYSHNHMPVILCYTVSESVVIL